MLCCTQLKDLPFMFKLCSICLCLSFHALLTDLYFMGQWLVAETQTIIPYLLKRISHRKDLYSVLDIKVTDCTIRVYQSFLTDKLGFIAWHKYYANIVANAFKHLFCSKFKIDWLACSQIPCV